MNVHKTQRKSHQIPSKPHLIEVESRHVHPIWPASGMDKILQPAGGGGPTSSEQPQSWRVLVGDGCSIFLGDSLNYDREQ